MAKSTKATRSRTKPASKATRTRRKVATLKVSDPVRKEKTAIQPSVSSASLDTGSLLIELIDSQVALARALWKLSPVGFLIHQQALFARGVATAYSNVGRFHR